MRSICSPLDRYLVILARLLHLSWHAFGRKYSIFYARPTNHLLTTSQAESTLQQCTPQPHDQWHRAIKCHERIELRRWFQVSQRCDRAVVT